MESPAANARHGQLVRGARRARVGRRLGAHAALPQAARRRPELSIKDVQPVGGYAVQLSFSDGHTHGLFSWEALHALAQHKYSRMRHHVQAIQAAQADVEDFRSRHRQRSS